MSETSAPELEQLTPKQIVAELDRHIIGQDDAKRAVAIALRKPLAAHATGGGIARRGQP